MSGIASGAVLDRRPDRAMTLHIDYEALTPDERDEICDWVRAHRLDPADVPAVVDIRYDPVFGEWVIPVYARRDGSHYVRPGTYDIVMHRVRRTWGVGLPSCVAEADES